MVIPEGQSISINKGSSELSKKIKLLGKNILKAGRDGIEFRKFKPGLHMKYETRAELEKEKDKTCALAIADYLQTLSEAKPTEKFLVHIDDFLGDLTQRIRPLDHGMWKDMAKVLKDPKEASLSELWLTDAIICSKLKDFYYDRWIKENISGSDIEEAKEAYSRASGYLESFDSRCRLGGVVNDILHIPIYIP